MYMAMLALVPLIVQDLSNTLSENWESLMFREHLKNNTIGRLKSLPVSYSRGTLYSPSFRVITLHLGTSAYTLEMDRYSPQRTHNTELVIRLYKVGKEIL
jgi:hypothetical protein